MANLKASVLALGLTLGAAAPAAATDIYFCNNDYQTIYVAIAYYNASEGDWYMYAYQKIYPGNCDTALNLPAGTILYHAFNEDRSLFWPADDYADEYYCLPDRGVNRRMYSGQCRNGEQLGPFYKASFSGRSYTIDINP